MASASSVLDGTIVSITHTIEKGYIMVVQHNNNYMSIYGNIGECMRQVGDNVLAGERIGRVGTTMNSVLHYELWHSGIAIDPMKYIVF
jgi:septal ring factor EnvC (AmiA/AmiB activator)